MGRRWLTGLVMAFAASCTSDYEGRLDAEGAEEIALEIPVCAADGASALRIDTVAVGLDVPWDVTFLPDGRSLVTERPGRVRVIDAQGVLTRRPWAELEVYAEAEAGLLGIDRFVGPDGAVEIYVAGTVQDLGDSRAGRVARAIARRIARVFDPERGHSVYLRVWRIDAEAAVSTVVVDHLPAGPIHTGGALRVGPDGLLYLTSGDAGDPIRAQDPSTTRGKILRYDRSGDVPAGNRRSDSPVFASGVRNPQGLAWLGPTGPLLAIDHGPTGLESEDFRTDQDELNVVEEGANLGWPMVTGATSGGALRSPIAEWPTAIAPGGLAISGPRDDSWSQSAFVTGLRGTTLERLVLGEEEGGIVVRCRERLLGPDWGRLRLVRVAPDGSLWVGTSNRDQRGIPRADDDLIVRLHAPPRQDVSGTSDLWN